MYNMVSIYLIEQKKENGGILGLKVETQACHQFVWTFQLEGDWGWVGIFIFFAG